MANKNEPQEAINVNDMAREYEEARQILQDSGASAGAIAVVDTEIKRIRCGNRPKTTFSNDGSDFMDIYNDGRVKLVVRASLPTDQFPKYNFLGKLLGPGGSTMKQLQEETMTRISILGRGSMRDKAKEEEMRSSGDVKYAHLNEQLHIEIIAQASPAEAHARVAFALTEIRKFITPEEDGNGMMGGDMMGGRDMMGGHGGPGPLMGMMGGHMGPPSRGRGRGGYGDQSAGRTMDFLEKARQSASAEEEYGGGGYDQFQPQGGYDDSYNGGGGGQGWTPSRGGPRGGPRGGTGSRGSPSGRGGPRGAPRGGRGGFGGFGGGDSFGDSSFGGGKAPPPSRGMSRPRGGRGRGAPY